MSQTPAGKKKRKFQRIPKEVPINVKKLAYPLPEGLEERGAEKNIGENGICFSTQTLYEPKTMLNLEIKLTGWQHHKKNVSSMLDPLAATAPLTAIAEVIWLKKLSGNRGYEVGVKFADIYEDDYKALKKHLDSKTLGD
jgi:hypothetical protein